MGSHHTLQDEFAFDESRLIYGSDDAHYESKPVSQDISKDLKAAIQITNRSKFLHATSIRFLWDQG
jgi:hypothetical protein